MTMDGNGIVPVMDVNRGYGDGYGYGGGWFMWIIVLFALMGGWGNGFGRNGYGNGPGLTQVEMQQGFDTQSVLRKLDGIQNGLCDGFYSQNNAINGVQREVLESRYNLGSQIAENRYAAQNCCCETNRNIDAVRAENYKNTCEITNAIHAEGEATRALIQQNTMQELRDKLADRDRDLMTANFQLSQQAQSANLVSTLRPFPQPAYITCSPYQAASTVYGCNNGCAC